VSTKHSLTHTISGDCYPLGGADIRCLCPPAAGRRSLCRRTSRSGPDRRDPIVDRSGFWFVPAHVDALLRLCDRDYIWMEIATGAMENALRNSLGMSVFDKLL